MKATKKIALTAKQKGAVVTLGNFDGIHIGHRQILGKVAERAKAQRLKSIVYTFEPHPLKVVAPHKSPQLILDKEDKEAVIKSLGISSVVFARFTRQFASKHPRQFVEEALVKGLSAKEVWVGSEFSFGRERLGTFEYLKILGHEFGFKAFAITPVKRGGEVVSSSRIRALIKAGEVKKAGALLGANYRVKGVVVKGRALGKEIGFPTANLKITSEILPHDGVYAAYALVNKKKYNAVVNIGVAPTLGEKPLTIEAHIMGFKRKIYNERIVLEFIKRLRDEKRFNGIDALASQIKKDIAMAGRCF
ncbi:bifunctional riboflavin kinase/FAD synthetase [bacterium]|nr:MAG: bifunctional riboflavin kinase/FAD synthetase [bacterium]